MTNAPNGSASIVIIGGGIQGLSIAHGLAKLGARGIRVLDAGYFQGGASGRNGTLIRGGFGSDAWTRLFSHSTRLWSNLSSTLGENIMFTPRGYLIVAQSRDLLGKLESMWRVHREHGVNSSVLTPAEVKRIEPAIDQQAILGAIYIRDGGVAPHHAAMHGYLKACGRLGVSVTYNTPVISIEKTAGRVSGVRTPLETVACETLVIAAGAHSVPVAALAGAELDGFPMRIEAMALEPVRPVIRSAIALPDRLCYLHQTARGEIVGGAEVAERPQVTLKSDLPAMAATARAYVEAFPSLGCLRILRQWAGMLHATPDWGPLIGRHPDIDNLWISAGWSYGFAAAPAAGELLARAIVKSEIDEAIKPFAVDRFRRKQPVMDSSLVLASVE